MDRNNWLYRYRTLLILLLLNIFSIILIINDNSIPETVFRSFLRDQLTSVNESFNYFESIGKLKEENRLLKESNAKLNIQIAKYNEIALQNIRFRKLFQLAQLGDFDYILAEVIGENPNFSSANLVLNRGKLDSIETDMAVVSTSGLVGRIIYVGENTSVVQLLNDKSLKISCRVQRTRSLGMIGWSKGNMLELLYFPKSLELLAGDLLVTSGLSNIYPEGIRIGTVRNISELKYDIFKSVQVEPVVDFVSLEEVFIVHRGTIDEK